MDDLRDLYQEVILDHAKHPCNREVPEGAGLKAEGHNPLCGDRLTVYVKMDGDRIVKVGFQGAGCAISTASASMMTQSVQGKTIEQAQETSREFIGLVTGREETEPTDAKEADLGKLRIFAGVKEFPVRVKCATLCWHTMRAAFDRLAETVTTEDGGGES